MYPLPQCYLFQEIFPFPAVVSRAPSESVDVAKNARDVALRTMSDARHRFTVHLPRNVDC